MGEARNYKEGDSYYKLIKVLRWQFGIILMASWKKKYYVLAEYGATEPNTANISQLINCEFFGLYYIQSRYFAVN